MKQFFIFEVHYMKRAVFFILIFFNLFLIFESKASFTSELSAKNNRADSIKTMYNYLIHLSINGDFDKIINNLKIIEYNLIDLKIDSLDALLNQKIGAVYRINGELDLAKKHLEEAETAYKKMQNKKRLANIYFLQSKIYLTQLDFETSITLCNKSLALSDEINDQSGKAKAYIQRGINYDYQDLYDNAIDDYRKGLNIYININNTLGMANGYNNIGVIYDLKQMADSALYYYQKSMELEEKLNNQTGIAGSKVNIGLIYQLKKHYTMAENMFNEALIIYKKENDHFGIGICYANLACLNKELKKYDLAIKNIDKSIGIALKTKDMIKLLEDLSTKTAILQENNNFKEALKTQSEILFIKDSIAETNKRNELQRLKSLLIEKESKLENLELEQKKNSIEIIQLRKNNQQLILFTILGSVLILGFLFFLYQIKKSPKK